MAQPDRARPGLPPSEGLYIAPRAPTDTWNLWHEAHIDPLLDRLIETAVALEGVNPDRVYLLGYSAGGDGVYQLAPRLADRWAAAAMMAGHPNETKPDGLGNVPFALQVGANDDGYQRNALARTWGAELSRLRAADPGGYDHFVELHEGRGHWMETEDRKAIPWMERRTRDPLPDRVVWLQDDVTHDRFYWLAVPPGQAAAGQEIIASRQGARFTVTRPAGLKAALLLNDAMTDLDAPLEIVVNGRALPRARSVRTIALLADTLATWGDPRLMFSARVELE